MRLHEIITEKAIPNSHYGYWVTDLGDILPVPYQSHDAVACQNGMSGDMEAIHHGWAAIHYPGHGPFSLYYKYPTSKTASGIRQLLRMAEQSGCNRYIVEGTGRPQFETAAQVSRKVAMDVREWNQIMKERIAKGLPARRPFRDDEDLYEDVMVDEIEMLPDQPANLSDFQPHFTDDPIWIDANDHNLSIRYHEGKTQHELGVFRGDVLIAILVTEPFYIDPSVDQIKLTAVAKNERQKGFMRLLVSFYRHHFGRLCSDQAQSADAMEMWKALIKQPMGLSILVWDTATGETRPAKGVPEDEIWNDEADVVLLVEAVDLHRYGNRHDANLLVEKARYPNQRRWDCAPHPLFP